MGFRGGSTSPTVPTSGIITLDGNIPRMTLVPLGTNIFVSCAALRNTDRCLRGKALHALPNES